MNYQQLIDTGIHHRELTEPEQALACFGQAFILVPDSAAAFNNYGNTLREMGFPQRAIPFLQHACILDPNMDTAHFNLAVATLMTGDLQTGMKLYESRWNFEHLKGMLPQFSQPQWRGQDLQNRTILIFGEQGHGDVIQFVRFLADLQKLKPKRILFQGLPNISSLLQNSFPGVDILDPSQPLPDFDYWCMAMSLPIGLNLTYDTLNAPPCYLQAPPSTVNLWRSRLAPKTQPRVGVCWSGRKDTWLNRHKAVPFQHVVELIRNNPQLHWINLQADATQEENQVLTKLGVSQYPGTIQCWADTAGLIQNLDLVIGMDTAVSHLAGALGIPVWIMLNQYALDWRWLLDRNDSPWYPSAKLFRQPRRGDWASVIQQICHYLRQSKL